jgi:type II secretory ATPase GspE/PulE/Tfp pilus assembly ATPase PilB-like protein
MADVTAFIANNTRETPIAAALNEFFERAAREGIADLHLETVADGGLELRIRNRDGLMFRAHRFDSDEGLLALTKIRQRANLSVVDTRAPQDGRITQIAAGRRLDVRISIVPTLHGSSCVMRILDSANAGMPIERLNMPDAVRHAFERIIDLPEGVLLSVGPTGSGKTSTLYSALNKINTVDRKINTAEDPVEYVLPGINQCQAGESSGTNFSELLRSFLRQDPDVILVGEIRDAETAKIAMQAGQTGHLVLSTLHANDALEAFTRLHELGVTMHALRASVKAIIAQRLLRKVCPHCAQPQPLDDEDTLRVAQSFGDTSGIEQVGLGCEACLHTGYSGRQAIFEMVVMDKNLRANLHALDAQVLQPLVASQPQYSSLLSAAARLAREGVTNYREVIRAVSDL